MRPAQSSADLDALRGLFREYEAWVAEPRCFAGFERELAELPGDYAPPRGLVLLALEDGAPAGCAALRRLESDAAEMKRLYLRPACRGHGLGRRLAVAIIAAARERGYRVLRLDTLPMMSSARALYADLGFAPRGPYASEPTPGALFLELRL